MMDASPADSKNAPTPTPPSEPLTSSPSSSPPDAVADTTTSRRAEKEVDDEQVERFYALLANIRALRGAFGAAATMTGKRKRTSGNRRGEEPPWRPKFRLEDFEAEVVCSRAGADAARKEQKRTCDCTRRMPAGSETGTVGVVAEDGDGGDAEEQNGPGGEAARRCALTLTN